VLVGTLNSKDIVEIWNIRDHILMKATLKKSLANVNNVMRITRKNIGMMGKKKKKKTQKNVFQNHYDVFNFLDIS
jgi:hypothetical protein